MEKIKHIFERRDDRGVFKEYLNGPEGWKSINGGTMAAGAILGNHYHKNCRAAFFVLAGKAQIWYKNIQAAEAATEDFWLEAGEGCIFEPYETHAVRFGEESSFLLLKNEIFNSTDQDIYPAPLI